MNRINSNSVILNFLPIRTGGGLQNSLSFIKVLACSERDLSQFTAVVRRGSDIHQYCTECGLTTVVVSDSTSSRLAFELMCRRYFHKGQTCFTLFGPPMFGSREYMLNVVGCAYSNLFYPEINFWSDKPRSARLFCEGLDMLRRRMIAAADFWIFETEVLRQRAIKLAGFPKDRVGVVRMSPSALVSLDCIIPHVVAAFDKKIPKGVRFLFLSGDHPNKRLNLIPDIALVMRRSGMRDFVFVTTISLHSGYAQSVAELFNRHGVKDHWCNLGPISSKDVGSLIHCCQAIALFSRLESFSNNFVEAWRMECPLIVTNADWAHDACGEAALYVECEDAERTAKLFLELARNPGLRRRMIDEGNKQLKNYPSVIEKNHAYMKLIQRAILLGGCSAEQRKHIHWPRISHGENT